MRTPRGPIGPGPVALLLVAVVAIPEVLKRCKPLAKSLGDFLVQTGNEVHRIAEDYVNGPSPAAAQATVTPEPAAATTAASEPTAPEPSPAEDPPAPTPRKPSGGKKKPG